MNKSRGQYLQVHLMFLEWQCFYYPWRVITFPRCVISFSRAVITFSRCVFANRIYLQPLVALGCGLGSAELAWVGLFSARDGLACCPQLSLLFMPLKNFVYKRVWKSLKIVPEASALKQVLKNKNIAESDNRSGYLCSDWKLEMLVEQYQHMQVWFHC